MDRKKCPGKQEYLGTGSWNVQGLTHKEMELGKKLIK